MFYAGTYNLPELMSGLMEIDLMTAKRLLEEAGHPTKIPVRLDLHTKYNLTPLQVSRLSLALVLSERSKVWPDERTTIKEGKDALPFFSHLRQLQQEEAWALYTDAAQRVLSVQQVSRGHPVTTVVPFEIMLRQAVGCGALGIVMAHNHPPGDVTPSQPDIDCANAFKKILDILGWELIDSLVIGATSWYSLENHKLIDRGPAPFSIDDLMKQLGGG